jgi:hypothetical protein
MGGDYSRTRFDPRANYHGVRLQQGRVLLDADFNESVESNDRRLQANIVDLVSPGPDPGIAGVAVVPRQTPTGFRISIDEKHGLTIGCGRMYVDGLLAENHGNCLGWDPVLAVVCGTEDVVYADQPYLPGVIHLAGLRPDHDGRRFLVYLEVWQREVTAVEDPNLIDPAIGTETSARMQTVWQVRILPDVGEKVDCATPDSDLSGWLETIEPSGGRLTTALAAPVQATDSVAVPSNEGYTGLEDHLYRVEIHDGGGIGTATFKWSRDNASVAARVVEVVSQNRLRLQSVRGESALPFDTGDWIEILDDWRELSGEGGDPARRRGEIRKVDDADTGVLVLDQDLPQEWWALIPEQLALRHMRVRRWDQKDKRGVIPVPAQGAPVPLENGIQVEFSLASGGGRFHSGDYWTFVARTEGASVEELHQAPPRGVHHHLARLAVVNPKTRDTIDCRRFWPT